MEEPLRKYLWDILERITFLEDATAPPLSLEQFSVNRIITAAVERHIEVIGEALKKALLISPDLPVTDAHKILGMRNRIAHGYDEVEPVLIWVAVKNHIPKLKEEVRKILNG